MKFRNFQRTACLTQKNTAPELKWSLECRRGRGVHIVALVLSRRFLDVVAGDSIRLVEIEFDVEIVADVEAGREGERELAVHISNRRKCANANRLGVRRAQHPTANRRTEPHIATGA